MSDEIRIPSADALRDASEMVDQAQLLRIALAGTSSQPGLLQRLESATPLVEHLAAILDQIRAVSDKDGQLAAEQSRQIAHIAAELEQFENRVSSLVVGTFVDGFLAEQGQKLVAEVAQRLATDGARESLEKAFRVIAGELNQGAQEVADAMLAEHHVRSVAELKAENLYLKKEVEAALDKRSARIEGAFQNMLLAFVGGAVVCGLAIYAAPLIM